MDTALSQNLDILKSTIKKDWDVVICVDGPEGVGKSVLAQQIAYFLDPSFNCSRMTMGLEAFEDAIYTANAGQAIVGDEMMRLLNSRSAMTKINKRIIELLAEVRQKNLFIVLVMPSFFDMDKYGALWRTTALIHVYTGDGLKRGFFAFFGERKKKLLYLLGKKFYDYRQVKPDFIGRFANTYLIDEAEYRAKKLKVLRRRPLEQNNAEDDRWKTRMAILIKFLQDKKILKQKKIAEVLNLHRDTLGNLIRSKKRPIQDPRVVSDGAERGIKESKLAKPSAPEIIKWQ